MKKPLIFNLLWAMVALGAFILGGKFSPPLESFSTSKEASTKTSSSRLSERSVALADLSSASRKNNTRSSNSPTLSEADLLELGQEFRRAKGPIARRLAFSEILKNLTAENAKL
ncbi:hypothetical protein N9908_06500, partial [Akkermansiaceae bacterium]|nr:hypothetical protein [Akkermansiaceae bacterium]